MSAQKTALGTAAVFLCLWLIISACISPALADTQGTATVTASALNMRSQASTASSVVTCLPRGTTVTVIGTADGWYQVSYKDYTGYMSADYLSFSGSTVSSGLGTGTVTGNQVRVRSGPSTGDSVITTVNKGTTMSVTGTSGSWYQVSYNGSTAYVSSTYMTLSSGSGSSSSSAVTSDASGTGTIRGTCVRMRSGPSTGYSILGTFNTGTTMTVTGSSGDWYKVSCNGTDGYVYKTYLTLSSGSTASDYTVTDTEDRTYTVTAAVNMRSGPSTDYTSLRVLGSGTTVTVTGTAGKWSQVSYNGSTGYIFSTYLTEGDTAASAASAAAAASGTYGEAIVNEAKKYLGVSYVYGGTSSSGFDCSGLVYYVYRQCGYSITRTATSQNSDGRYVSRSELQPGDIIIFYNSAMSAIGHAGIYIGDGQFIHASSAAGKVVITSLSANYYNTHYYSARRIVK